MADRGVSAPSLPDDWPDRPDPILALNRMGSFDWDLDTGLTQMDAQAHELFDLRADEFDDRIESLTPRLHEADVPRLAELVTRALKEGGENYGAYFRIRRRDGSLRWTHTQGYIRRDATGRARRIIGIVRDATQELRDSRARSEQAVRDSARRRQAEVASATMAALAHARTVRDVIDVLRETEGRMWMGAASLVMGLVEGGRIRLVAEGPTGDFLPGTRITGIDEPYPMSDAVRTLTPRFIESPEEFGARYPILWPHLAHLHITSAAYLPLVAQGRPIGGIGLLYGDRHGFTTEERDILVALTSTIAQSLQRAMLYEQESDLAQELQQAMLPRSLPRVPDADVAVRYRAAVLGGSPGRNIGGDWYDLIPLPGGRVGAVVGDVQGHDTQAAAVMGQLRIVLRAYAAEGHPRPPPSPAPPSSCTNSTPTASRPACTPRPTCPPASCSSSAPGTSTRWCGTPTEAAGASPSGADCRSGCPRCSTAWSTPCRPWNWTPGRRWCCAPTAWSSSRGWTPTRACANSVSGSRPAPRTWATSPTCSSPAPPNAAARTTSPCCSCAAGHSPAASADGSSSTWRPATRGRCGRPGTCSARPSATGAPGAAPTRSNSSPTNWSPTR